MPLRDLLSKKGRLKFTKDRLEYQYNELVTERDMRKKIAQRRADIRAINEEIISLVRNESLKGKDSRSVQGESGPPITTRERTGDQESKPQDSPL